MRTLNVFKLARNADYNVGSPDGKTRKTLSLSTSSASSSSSSSSSATSDSGYIKSSTSPSFKSSKNNNNSNNSDSISSSNNSSRKSTIMTMSSLSGESGSGGESSPSLPRPASASSYSQIDTDSVLFRMDQQKSPQQLEQMGQESSTTSSSLQTQTVSNGNGRGQNGNGNSRVYDMEPDTYKRLINEAPFLTTAREPPLDLDLSNYNDINNYDEQLCVTKKESDSAVGGGAGGTGEDSTDGPTFQTTSSITTTIASKLNNILTHSNSNGSNHGNTNSNTKSISRSVSSSSGTEIIRKTESRISMATSTKSSTTPSFDLELDWVDPNLIKEGRAFVRKHFLSVMFAHFIGMAFLLCVRPVAAILLRNGKFHKPAKRHNWHMYLCLFRRLKSWYEKGDLTDVCDPVTANILNMRRSICSAGKNFRRNFPPPAQDLMLNEDEHKLHSAVREDLNQVKEIKVETKNIAKIFATVNPDVPWSQYDLAVTQFAFFGFISLFPSIFGIHNPSQREMKAFHHLWACFGQLLGLESRFNLCKEENFDMETNRRIFKHVFLFSFSISDNGSYRMTQLMSDGCKWFTIFITRMKLVLLFMLRDVAQLQSTNLNAVITWYDKVQYVAYIFWCRFLVRIFFLRILGNFLLRILVASAYTLMVAQNQWRSWRMKRRKNQDFVVFPSSVALQLQNNISEQPKV